MMKTYLSQVSDENEKLLCSRPETPIVDGLFKLHHEAQVSTNHFAVSVRIYFVRCFGNTQAWQAVV